MVFLNNLLYFPLYSEFALLKIWAMNHILWAPFCP